MKTLDLLSRTLLQFLLAACAAFLCVRLVTGCAYIRALGQKANVVECLKTAYAEGNAPQKIASAIFGGEVAVGDGEAGLKAPRANAVSNKIESLVVSGDLSRKQADRLHTLAQTAYDKLLDHIETELSKSNLTATVTAPAN